MRWASICLALIAFALSGCAEHSLDPLKGLTFSVETAIYPPRMNLLQTSVNVVNNGTESTVVHYGGCPLNVRLHSGSYDGPVIYASAQDRVCTTIAVEKTLNPGESLFLSEGDTVSLPSGHYFVTVRVDVNGGIEAHAGEVTL